VAIDPIASLARAQRAHDHLNLLRVVRGEANVLNQWVAISLADGSIKQETYDTKAQAVRHQLHETQCAYLFVNGFPTVGEMRYYLDENERLYDSGYRLEDPATYVNPEAML
jgi:hypothetical protein